MNASLLCLAPKRAGLPIVLRPMAENDPPFLTPPSPRAASLLLNLARQGLSACPNVRPAWPERRDPGDPNCLASKPQRPDQPPLADAVARWSALCEPFRRETAGRAAVMPMCSGILSSHWASSPRLLGGKTPNQGSGTIARWVEPAHVAGLVPSRRMAQERAHIYGSSEASGIIERGSEGQRNHGPAPRTVASRFARSLSRAMVFYASSKRKVTA